MLFPRLSAVNAFLERANHVPYVQESEALEWSRRGKNREARIQEEIVDAAAREAFESMMMGDDEEYFGDD